MAPGGERGDVADLQNDAGAGLIPKPGIEIGTPARGSASSIPSTCAAICLR
jgi:hypothetical protein